MLRDRVVRVLAPVLVTGVAACGGGAGDGSGPAAVTREYLRAFAQGDGATACRLMTPQQRRITAVADGMDVTRTCERSVADVSRRMSREARDLLAVAALAEEGSGAPGSAWVRVKGGPWRGELVTVVKVDDHWLIASQVAPEH